MVNIEQLKEEIEKSGKTKRRLEISQEKAEEFHKKCESYIDMGIKDALNRNIHCRGGNLYVGIHYDTCEEEQAMKENISLFDDVVLDIENAYRNTGIYCKHYKDDYSSFVIGSHILFYNMGGFAVKFNITW